MPSLQAIDLKLGETVTPLRKLGEEIKQIRSDNFGKETAANRLLSNFNKSIDQVEAINKEISRHVSALGPMSALWKC